MIQPHLRRRICERFISRQSSASPVAARQEPAFSDRTVWSAWGFASRRDVDQQQMVRNRDRSLHGEVRVVLAGFV